MLRSNADAISAGLIALATAALLLAIAKGGEGASARYWRSEAKYSIRVAGDAGDVAAVLDRYYKCDFSAQDRYFVGQEIARMNHIPADRLLLAGQPGSVLRVPVYRRLSCVRATCTYDIRNWHLAKQYSRGVIPDSGPLMKVGTIKQQAGRRYRVSSALLIAIRCKENCKRSRDAYALGFKCPGVWNTNIRTQYHAAACLIGAWQLQHGEAATHTEASIRRLSFRYSEGSTSWAADVWRNYKKARGR